MSCNAAKNAGVLVLHLSPDYAPAERLIVGRRSNRAAPARRRFEGGSTHAQRREDLLLAEMIQRVVGETLQGDAQNHEADVAILGPAAGISGERNAKGRA